MKKTPCALVLLLFSGSLSFAADNAKPQNVIITIAAEDKSHNPVPDLKLEEVSLKDNGASVVPSSFVYAGAESKDWILAIDSSGSMRREPLWRPAVEAAVKQLSSLMRERGDRVAIVTIDSDAYIDQDLTSDEHEVRAAVDKIQPSGGTALYDALVASADYLAHKRQQGRQQVVWVVTDGGENASTHSLEQALAQISGTGVPILFSLFGNESRGMNSAQRLATSSGGRIFKLTGKDKCEDEAKKLAAFADSEYVIAFTPASDAPRHSIRVTTSRAGINFIDQNRVVESSVSAK